MRISFGELRIGEIARQRIQASLEKNWVSEGENVADFERQLVEEAARDPNLAGPFAEGENTPEFLNQNGICVGDPDDVIATVKRFADIGIDQLVLVPVVGWHTPHEKTLDSIRILGEKVFPQFRS